MGFGLRDRARYGIFKANSNKGIVQVTISIYGFGEKIEVHQNKKLLCSVDTSEEEDGYYDETDDKLCVEHIVIEKPFLRTLKRFR